MKQVKNFNMKSGEQHPFHLVDPSPWPMLTSLALCALVSGFVTYFQYQSSGYVFMLSIVLFCCILFCWFADIIIEATFEGHHTYKVQQGMSLGMCLFIMSEVLFFFSFFWGLFHCSISPVLGMWPPLGITVLDPWGLPLWNTMMLLASGVTITCAHKAILCGNHKMTVMGMAMTMLYGVLFSIVQGYEYNVAPYAVNDSIFGSLFFVLTGFHGSHIIMGIIFLMVCLFSQINYQFTMKQHVGFEGAVLYWHFVDVVWLFLFVIIYIWGG